MTVIGITGSVGKTTTKELAAHILQDRNVLFTPAYVNSEMGVAKWLLRELPKKNPEDDVVLIVEMGAYRKGEIANLCGITVPDIGIITFIGTQHIALFGSQEKLLHAKAELFQSLPENGMAFANIDCALCERLDAFAHCPITKVCTGGRCDIEALQIEETGKGIRFVVEGQQYHVPLHGTHNTTNALLAIGVARYLELDHKSIAARLATFTPPHSTFALREQNGVSLLDDTHNASPESFRAAIAWAKAQPAQNKVLLTPGLIELGVDENRIHRELGSQASGIFSRVIFTAKHGKNAFASGYTGSVEQLHKSTEPLQEGDLLVCIGRVNASSINRILP